MQRRETYSVFARRYHTETYLKIFLISAVAAILIIRLYLELTGYPYLGGRNLHIAHMLWGGLLMTVALVMAFSLIGRISLRWVCVIGGIGFGTFIDEIGKFVTRDNNYFYEPAVSLIYIILVSIFITVWTLMRRSRLSKYDFLMNAVEGLEDIARHEFDEEKEIEIRNLLENAGPTPLAQELRHLIEQVSLSERRRQSWIVRIKNRFHRFYRRAVKLRVFASSVIFFFVVQMIVTFVMTFAIVFLHGLSMRQILEASWMSGFLQSLDQLSFAGKIQLSSSVISAAFILLGVIKIRSSRLAAYRMFERSLLVSIFITQIFAFYQEQFAALAGLAFNILIWSGLQYMMLEESLEPEGLNPTSMEERRSA